MQTVYVEGANAIGGFLEKIGQGISFSPSKFDGARSNKNWVGQCIMALDFDGGISPDQAIERINAYDITPSG